MAWLSLVAAGLFEMLGVNSINQYVKEKNLKNMVLLMLTFSASFLLLSYGINRLPMSTAYAVWTGIGASGGAILGIVYYGESKEKKRLFFIACILLSAIGLKFIS